MIEDIIEFSIKNYVKKMSKERRISTSVMVGSIVALVTPMHLDGSIDYKSLQLLIDWHITKGTNAIVIAGTTGESATLSFSEHCELISTAISYVDSRIPIIAGCGSNSTSYAIALCDFAKSAGVNASLQVVPYYNKPTQNGMYEHFCAIAKAVDLPIILYSVPSRTATDLEVDTILHLAEMPGIIGIKDASGDLKRGSEILCGISKKNCSKNFTVYSGDDFTAPSLMLMGARGNISVTANIVPKAMSSLCAAAIDGNVLLANKIQFELWQLHKQLFCESNPIPVKWALEAMGLIEGGIRQPLTKLCEFEQAKLMVLLERLQLI